jgi:PAS domain S-box-containing protein
MTMLDAFFNQSPDGAYIMMLDKPIRWDDTVDKEQVLDDALAHQHVTNANQALFGLYHATAEEILGKTPGDLFVYHFPQGREAWRKLFDSGHMHNDAEEHTIDGMTIWIESDYNCTYDERGYITGHFGIQRKISERRQADIKRCRLAEDALCESEAKYRSLIDSQEAAISTIDAEGVFHYINANGAALFDTPDFVIGKRLHDLLPSQIADWHLAQVRQVIATGKGMAVEYPNLGAGQPSWRRVSIQPIQMSEGPITLATVNSLDITERKQSEEQLREQEERFRSFMEQSADGLLLTDGQGKIIEWNRSLAQITGLSRERALGQAMWDIQSQLVTPERRPFLEQATKALRELLHNGQSPLLGKAIEAPLPAPDGGIKVLQLIAFPIQSRSGYRIGAVVRDITEQKRLETALEAESARRRILFEEAPDGILTFDPQTTGFVEFNTAAHQQLGYTREEFAGLHFLDVEVHETADDIWSHIQEITQNGKSDFETLHRTKQGEIRNVHVTVQIVEIQGQPEYYCTWRDTTDRKRAEKVLRESEERFSKAFLASPDSVVISDLASGRYQEVNESFLRDTGYERSEIIGFTSLERNIWATPEDRARLLSTLQAQGSVRNLEAQYRCKSGEIRDALVSVEMIDLEDRGKHLLAVVRDITEANRAAEALRRSEDRFSTIFHSSPNAIALARLSDNRFIDVNSAWENICGFSREEAIGKSAIELNLWVHQYERDRLKALLIEHGTLHGYEMQLRGRSGSILSLLMSAEIIDLQGESCILTTAQDITERKRMEKNLGEREELLNMMGQIAHVGGWDFDVATGDGHWTEEVARIHDMDLDTQPTKAFGLSFYQGESQTRITAALQDAIEHGTPYELEVELVSAIGAHKWVRTIGIPVMENGKVVSMHGSFQDITERKQAEEKLRNSEMRFATIFQASPNAMTLARLADSRLIDVNKAWEVSTGWSKEEALGKNPLELNLWVDLSQRERIKAQLTTHSPLQGFEMQMRTRSGALISLWMSAEIITLQGETYLSTIAQDITERKKSEERLRENEERFRTVADFTYDMEYWLNENKQLEYMSPSCQRITGHDRNEFLQNPALLQVIIHPADREKYEQHVMNEFNNTEAASLDFRIITTNGEERWINHTCQGVKGEAGQWRGRRVSNRDITERKWSENKVRESEAKYRLLVETAKEGIWSMDCEHLTSYVNQAMADMLGYEPDEMLGRKVEEFLFEEDSEFHQERMQNRHAGQDESYERRFRRRDGSSLWTQVSARVLKDSQGNFDGSFAMFTDINERKQAEEALRESERKLSTLLSNLIGFAYRCHNDRDWTMEYISEGCQEITGYRPGDLIGNRTLAYNELIQLADRDQVWETIQSALKEQMPYHLEYRIISRSGTEKWVWEQGLGIFENGILLALEGFITDVTDKKHAETALRASEEKYRGLMGSLDTAVSTVDYEGRFLYSNDMGAESMGRSVQELIGKRMSDFFPEPFASNQLTAVRDIFQTDRGAVFEMQGVSRYGPRWFRVSLQPIHDETGQVAQVLVNATDIHALKTAQEELQEMNRTLEERVKERSAQVQDLFDNAPVGYHSIDIQGRFTAINRTELNMLGYTKEELLGEDANILFTPESAALRKATHQKFLADGKDIYMEIDVRRKDGSTFPAVISASAIFNENGQFLSTRSTMTDITKRKQAEQALLFANHELERAMRMKDEFLASMSHELRTPLTGILGLSESLQEQVYGPLNERQFKSLSNIEASGRHLLDLINDVLDVSKLEAGKISLEIEQVFLSQVCQASLQLVKGMAHKKKQKVSFSIFPVEIKMQGDNRRIKQILVNLLSNAIKYTPESGLLGLEVTGDEANQVISLSVWDQGIGIKSEDLAKLFKPFVQLDSSLSRQQAGTGLGLVLVKDLVELHDGTISVTSTFGEGSRFTVTLPWNVGSHSNIEGAVIDPDIASSQEPAGKDLDSPQVRIMLVEDDELNATTLSDFLHSNHFEVAAVRNGYEFLEQVTKAAPDLILMDIQMPGMDGLEATRRLRGLSDAHIAAIPVIAVTALAIAGDRERCLAAGANDYLTKPFRMKELINLINSLLLKHDG